MHCSLARKFRKFAVQTQAKSLHQFGQMANLNAHLHLASLRPAGTKTRQLPTAFGFKTVSCANYWFELVAWAAFVVMTQELAALGFLVVAFMQLVPWAQKR